MLDGSKRAQLDQDMAAIIDVFPPLWRGLFVQLCKEGFTESQAMELVKAYIIGNK